MRAGDIAQSNWWVSWKHQHHVSPLSSQTNAYGGDAETTEREAALLEKLWTAVGIEEPSLLLLFVAFLLQKHLVVKDELFQVLPGWLLRLEKDRARHVD